MSRRVREALRRGRRDLHREMSVAALYIPPVPGASPIPVTVRPQDLPGSNGRPGGGDQGYAQVADLKPKLVFCTDDAPALIRVNAIVSVEPGEAYRIAFVHPQHGITITAEVVRLSADEAAGLPVPADGAVPGPFPHLDTTYVVPNSSGYGIYSDTSGPRALLGVTPTWLVNDRGSVDETQKPRDIVTFYDGTFLRAPNGDSLAVQIAFVFMPSTDAASELSVDLVVGTNVVAASQHVIALGAGVEHVIRAEFLIAAAAWDTIGARVRLLADGAGAIGSVTYSVHRLHKAAA